MRKRAFRTGPWDETIRARRSIPHGRFPPLDAFQSELVALLPRLRRLARALARNEADAQDLVQEAVERALAKRRGFQAGTRLDSWVFTIMRRLWIDQGRSRTRWNKVVTPEDAFTSQQPDASQAGEALRADALAVQRALKELPDDQRLAVALVLIDGLSYAEAAEVAGVPAGTLTSRLVRGRQALVARLGEAGVAA